MNNQHPKTKKRIAKTELQAADLASLTRALSHCCLDKEERICKSFGLHASDGRVLAAMLQEEFVTPSEVAERLGIGNSRVTPLIDRLLKKGLVTRTEGEHDRRTKRVGLTAEGRAIASSLREFEVNLHRLLLSQFPASRRTELLNSLHELRDAMDEIRQGIPQ